MQIRQTAPPLHLLRMLERSGLLKAISAKYSQRATKERYGTKGTGGKGDNPPFDEADYIL